MFLDNLEKIKSLIETSERLIDCGIAKHFKYLDLTRLTELQRLLIKEIGGVLDDVDSQSVRADEETDLRREFGGWGGGDGNN